MTDMNDRRKAAREHAALLMERHARRARWKKRIGRILYVAAFVALLAAFIQWYAAVWTGNESLGASGVLTVAFAIVLAIVSAIVLNN